MDAAKFIATKEVKKLLTTDFIYSKGWETALILYIQILNQHSKNHLAKNEIFTNNNDLIIKCKFVKFGTFEYEKLNDYINKCEEIKTNIYQANTEQLTCEMLIKINEEKIKNFSFIIEIDSGLAHNFILE